MAGAPWTAEEIMFLWENRGKMTKKQMAVALKRPYHGACWKLRNLDEADFAELKAKPKATAKPKPVDGLKERFKHPLLRVAITPGGLPPDWTPIDRLDELELYSRLYERG